MSDQEVIVAFQIREYAYEGDERELLGVFTSVDLMEEAVDQLDPEAAAGSSVCYYIAELDSPGEEAQWEMFKDFPEISDEEMQERAEKDAAERAARIDRNRRNFFRSE